MPVDPENHYTTHNTQNARTLHTSYELHIKIDIELYYYIE